MPASIAAVMALVLSQNPAATPLPDPLQAGWQGEPVCERLLEDDRQRVLRCTFAPGIGHERHRHRPHFGYALAGGRMRITDASGVRENVIATGSTFTSAGVEWHEAFNIGDTTIQYLIVESKAADAPAPPAEPRLVGVWHLVSLETHWPDGRVTQPWGLHPLGRLTYDATGLMSAVLMHEGRNQADGHAIPDDLQDEQAAYFGAYTVDPVAHRVFHHVAASLRGSESGTIERPYEFKDGSLVFTVTGKGAGALVKTFQTWKRSESEGGLRPHQ